MWLGDWKNLISWDGKCCLNLVWFEFSHRTVKLSQTVHMQSSHYGLCWLNQIIVPHSSPQILQPEVWSWSSSDPPILRKQPTAMCGLYSLGEIHLLSLLLRYTARLLLNMQVRLVAFTHLRTVLTGEAGGPITCKQWLFCFCHRLKCQLWRWIWPQSEEQTKYAQVRLCVNRAAESLRSLSALQATWCHVNEQVGRASGGRAFSL